MKRLLLSTICSAFFCFYGQAQNLVAWYQFNGNANDFSGNNFNGTAVGPNVTSAADCSAAANASYSFAYPGNPNQANGIDVPHNKLLNPGAYLTIDITFTASQVSGFNPVNSSYCSSFDLLDKGTDGDNGWYGLRIPSTNQPASGCGSPADNGKLIFSIHFSDGTYGSVASLNVVNTGVCYHAIATYNGSTMSLTLNGVLQNSVTVNKALALNSNKLTIGYHNNLPNAGYWFNGKIDDLKIYSSPVPTLVASYTFNGNANDASGNGNNGIVNGATLTTDRFGNANSAYSFNGINNFIRVPDAASLRFSGPFTINAWVQPAGFYNGDCQGNTIVQKGGYLSQNAYNMGYGDNLLDGGNCSAFDPNKETFFGSYDVGGTQYATYDADIVQLNKWYMITEVYDGTSIKLYTNGKLQGTSPVTNAGGAPNTSDLFIGYFGTGDGTHPYWLNGKLDDISLYNGALPDAQIFDTYINDLKKPGSGNGIQLTSTGSLSTSPYINVGSGFDFGTQPFTYETWIKRDVIGTTLGNFGKAVFLGDNNGSWGIGILNDNSLFFTKVGINSVNSTGIIADTKWHHIAVVYTGTQIQFYIDGAAAGSASYTDNFSNTSGNYFIGPRQSFGNSNGDQTLDGRIDETRIWRNVALTQTQIRDWMCKKITSSHPAYTSLYAYYHFDEGAGTSIYGIGGHPGTLINNPAWLTSGAALGDASAYDYTNATKTATLSASTGEAFTATSTTGAPDGIQVYRVDTIPNPVAGTNAGGNHKYFGVFQAGGANPTYTAVYNYNGNPLVSAGNESSLRLFKRTDNSVTTWTDCNATLNTTAKTLTAAGQSTEYILGSSLIPLPLKLVAFNARKESTVAKLDWNTLNESNLLYFNVEKSIDGRTFVSLTTLAAKGLQQNTYNTTDASPANGNNYYRLKIVDKDGAILYSQVVVLNFSGKNSISLFPNPASTEIHIFSSAIVNVIQVMDISGRLLKIVEPSSTNSYSIQDLRKGTYFIKIISSDSTNIIKLQKL